MQNSKQQMKFLIIFYKKFNIFSHVIIMVSEDTQNVPNCTIKKKIRGSRTRNPLTVSGATGMYYNTSILREKNI